MASTITDTRELRRPGGVTATLTTVTPGPAARPRPTLEISLTPAQEFGLDFFAVRPRSRQIRRLTRWRSCSASPAPRRANRCARWTFR